MLHVMRLGDAEAVTSASTVVWPPSTGFLMLFMSINSLVEFFHEMNQAVSDNNCSALSVWDAVVQFRA